MSSTATTPLLLITHEFYPKRGGIATYAEEMTLAAQKAGYEINVWASNREGMMDRSTPFPLFPIPNIGSLGWTCRHATATMLRTHRAQVERSLVYLPEPGPIFTMMYAPLLFLPKPKALALTLHGTEILRFSRPPHRKFLFNRLLKRADRIGVVSNYNRELLLGKFPATDPEKIRVVPGALRHDFSNPPARKRDRLYARVRIITVGRIHPRKGQHYVMEALAQLPENLRAEVEYHIVGPVVKGGLGYVEQLRKTADECGVHVEFVGEVDDDELPQIYADADIFAMTSVQSGISIEGFGLVYLEAAACGLPVVAHDTGGVAEAVRNGESGFVIQPGDTAALTEAITKLIESPQLREEMANAGKTRAAELSWQTNVEAHFGKLM
ncbi:glycosyltransferase family 4 protein [Cerasicoccus maritimus]|uniref:glycosyltransferase family 4 protein n=1 Tax=Cerasicoccus maritimus TaxID=490089 RepID=UPI002852BE4A|nr:glycosyltransferase family 4 protein [Cerasicoccus maritimus]